MKNKVIISKKFGGHAIEVKVTDTELSLEVSLEDFISQLAQRSSDGIIKEIGQTAGNPALMMTNSQLQERLLANANIQDITDILRGTAEGIIADVKASSVVAV